MSIRYLLAATAVIAILMATSTWSWAIALFIASVVALHLPSWLGSRTRLQVGLKFFLYTIIAAIIYMLSYGPAVALDQCVYNGNPLNGKPYGSVELLNTAYPIQAAIQKWPRVSRAPNDWRPAYRRLFAAYNMQWRDLGSNCRIFLDGMVDELAATIRSENDG